MAALYAKKSLEKGARFTKITLRNWYDITLPAADPNQTKKNKPKVKNLQQFCFTSKCLNL